MIFHDFLHFSTRDSDARPSLDCRAYAACDSAFDIRHQMFIGRRALLPHGLQQLAIKNIFHVDGVSGHLPPHFSASSSLQDDARVHRLNDGLSLTLPALYRQRHAKRLSAAFMSSHFLFYISSMRMPYLEMLSFCFLLSTTKSASISPRLHSGKQGSAK